MPLLDLKDEQAVKAYDTFAKNCQTRNAMEDLAWRHVKNNWDAYYIYLEKAGEIYAALSILTVRSVGDKKLAYAPRGPLVNEFSVALLEELYAEAEKYLPMDEVFVLRCDPEFLYDETLQKDLVSGGFKVINTNVIPHGTIQPRLNMRLFLEGKTKEELMTEFHSKTRYNIRLSNRKGVETHYSTDKADLKVFYDTHVIMSERQGITHRPYEYFERLFEAYLPYLRIYISTFEGEVLSAALCLSYGDTTWYMYGGSTNSHRNLMPNYSMQWSMIEWAFELGMKYYDFGGIFEEDEEDGLYRFKRGFTHQEGTTEFIGEIDRIYDETAYESFMAKNWPK